VRIINFLLLLLLLIITSLLTYFKLLLLDGEDRLYIPLAEAVSVELAGVVDAALV